MYARRSGCALLAFALVASAQTAVEITAEPYHRLVLENEYVRVFQVELPVGKATLLHHHRYDYVFVTLGMARVSNEVEGKPAATLELFKGQAGLVEGGFTHMARNLGALPFQVVAAELLPAATRRAEAAPEPRWKKGSESFKNAYLETVLVRGDMRVTTTEIFPGGVLPEHTHSGPHLVIAITDLELRNRVGKRAPVPVRQKPGEVAWITPGPAHSLTNVGPKPARFATIEFQPSKPSARDLSGA